MDTKSHYKKKWVFLYLEVKGQKSDNTKKRLHGKVTARTSVFYGYNDSTVIYSERMYLSQQRTEVMIMT